jgi:hypothetical protein
VTEPYLFCIRCYRRYPNDQQYTHSPCCGTNLVTLECAQCGNPRNHRLKSLSDPG